MMDKYKQIISFLILFLSLNSLALAEQNIGQQILSLTSDITFTNQIKDIKNADQQALAQILNSVVNAANDDLSSATIERQSLQKHLTALQKIQLSFDVAETLGDFGLVSNTEYLLDNDECNIADKTFDSFQDFDCDLQYEHAISIWKRTLLAHRILLKWKKPARKTTLQQIQQSEKRWVNFSEQVTADQYPWETLANGWFIKGSIATPPRHQFRLIHPVAVLSYADETDKYNQELGIEIVGYRMYAKQNYQPVFGVSVFALLESDDAIETGYGLMISRNNFMFGVVQQDSPFKEDDTKLLIGYNLAQLFENKKNKLAEKKLQIFKKVDEYKQKFEQLSGG